MAERIIISLMFIQKLNGFYQQGTEHKEGIYSPECDGIGGGPEGKGTNYMVNVVLLGLDPVRVDIIAHWIAGHEPGILGLFHIAVERGMSDVLNPSDIPVYEWYDRKAKAVQLESITRMLLLTCYLARDYGKGYDPRYHMVDEEFAYTSTTPNSL